MCFYDMHIYVYIIYISIPCTLHIHIFFTKMQNFVIASMRIRVFNHNYLQKMAANLAT